MQLEILTEVFVPGVPKTKGSLNVRGRHVEEAVAGSSRWRALVAERVRADRARRGLTVPWPGPVRVRIVSFYVQTAADERAGRIAPTEPRAGHGDVDKLERNVLDALKDAGAYVDDALVISTDNEEAFVGVARRAGQRPGQLIQAWAVPEHIVARRRAELAAEYARWGGLVAA